MLINSDDAEKRLNNPLNLMNRMRVGLSSPKKNAMDLFIKKESNTIEDSSEPTPLPTSIPSSTAVGFVNPFRKSTELIPAPIPAHILNSNSNQHPKTDDLIDDADSSIKLATAHNTALELLTSGLNRLKTGVDNGNIEEKKLPAILTATSKIITDIRKERLEREKINKGDQNVHFHFYCPEQRKIDTYDVIEVNS